MHAEEAREELGRLEDIDFGDLEVLRDISVDFSEAAEHEERGRPRTMEQRPRIGEMRRGLVVKRQGCFFEKIEYTENGTEGALSGERSGFGWRITGYGRKKIASLKGNMLGTKYVMKRKDLENELAESLLVEYTGLFSEGGPRSFQVFISSRDKTARETASRQNKPQKDARVRLVNKQPYYNTETDTYVLNFNGRVTLPSVRNFQIIHPHDATYITMIFGKISETEYVLDYTYPWNAVDAFGVALSSIGLKLAHD